MTIYSSTSGTGSTSPSRSRRPTGNHRSNRCWSPRHRPSMKTDTLLVHAGEPRPRAGGAVAMPIYQSSTFVPGDDPSAWERALTPRTRAFYLESMTNPMVRVADLPAAASFARSKGMVAIIDNTFATARVFAAAARVRPGRPQRDQVPERPQRPHRRRADGIDRAGPRGQEDARSSRRLARPARLLPPPARAQDAGRSLPAAVRDGAGGGG